MRPALKGEPELDFQDYKEPEYTYKPKWTGTRVPSIGGMTLVAAKDALGNKGLSYSIVYVSSNAPKGTVIGSSPAARSRVAPGGSVTIRVSKGPQSAGPKTKPPKVVPPDQKPPPEPPPAVEPSGTTAP